MNDDLPRIEKAHSGEQAQQEYALQRAIELPIIYSLFLMPTTPLDHPQGYSISALPVVFVDDSGRPDVRDFIRIMMNERQAVDVSTQIWLQSHEQDTYIMLMITWDDPAACQVTLWFSIPDNFLTQYVELKCQALFISTMALPSGTTMSTQEIGHFATRSLDVEVYWSDLKPFLAKAEELHAHKQRRAQEKALPRKPKEEKTNQTLFAKLRQKLSDLIRK